MIINNIIKNINIEYYFLLLCFLFLSFLNVIIVGVRDYLLQTSVRLLTVACFLILIFVFNEALTTYQFCAVKRGKRGACFLLAIIKKGCRGASWRIQRRGESFGTMMRQSSRGGRSQASSSDSSAAGDSPLTTSAKNLGESGADGRSNDGASLLLQQKGRTIDVGDARRSAASERKVGQSAEDVERVGRSRRGARIGMKRPQDGRRGKIRTARKEREQRKQKSGGKK